MTTINALPPAPTRGDSVNFAAVADTFVAALPPFVTQVNAVASEINAAKIAAETAATTATTKANEAATSASNAATSASSAATSASSAATSASSASTSASTATTQAGIATTKAAEAAASAASVGSIFAGASATTRSLTFSNTNATDATANACLSIDVGGPSGGDPYLRWHIPNDIFWHAAVDNSNNNTWKLGTGDVVGAGTLLAVGVSGTVQAGPGAGVATGSSDFLNIVSAGAANTFLRWHQNGVQAWSAGTASGDAVWRLREGADITVFSVTNAGAATIANGLTVTAGNSLFGSADGGDTLRFLDVQNTNTGASGGVIIRLISSNVAGSGSTSADLIKYKNGSLFLNNNETDPVAFIGFGVGGVEQARITSAGAFSSVSTITGTALIPSAATVPANGMYLPAANTVGFATASAERLRIDSIGQVKYTDPAFPITMPQALCKFGAFTTVANGASGNAFQAISVNGTLIAGTNSNFLATATPDVVCLSGWGMRGGAGSNPLVTGNLGAWFENNAHIVWTLEVDCNNEGSSNTAFGDHNRGVGIMVNTGSTYSPDTGIWIHRQTGAGSAPGWQRGLFIDGARQVGIQIEAMTAAAYPSMTPAPLGTINALLVNVIGDTVGRFWITETGSHNWGSGSAVGDVSLSRSGVGTLTLAGGLVVGSATGGGKGAGTINVAGDIYKNNLAYTNPDYVFEHAYTGHIDRFAANDGAASYAGLRSLAEVERITRETLRLPGITDNAMGMFSRTDFLLEKTEEIFLHLFDHEKRLTALAA